MFDDLDDDDVTDLIPGTEAEKSEKEYRREQEKRGRRMTVSEVRIGETHLSDYSLIDSSRIPA